MTEKRPKVFFFTLGMLIVAGLLSACNEENDGGEKSKLSESCTKTSDCDDELRCVDLECVLTGSLTWQNPPPFDTYNWQDAIDYCAELSIDDHSDWRLPTISELRSLIRGCPDTETDGICRIKDDVCLDLECADSSCSGCASEKGPASGCYWPKAMTDYCGTYWSSSPLGDYDGSAWAIRFEKGQVDGTYGTHAHLRVRCVR